MGMTAASAVNRGNMRPEVNMTALPREMRLDRPSGYSLLNI
jgi:hypothetical protein